MRRVAWGGEEEGEEEREYKREEEEMMMMCVCVCVHAVPLFHTASCGCEEASLHTYFPPFSTLLFTCRHVPVSCAKREKPLFIPSITTSHMHNGWRIVYDNLDHDSTHRKQGLPAFTVFFLHA
jgi:hypothetical protein